MKILDQYVGAYRFLSTSLPVYLVYTYHFLRLLLPVPSPFYLLTLILNLETAYEFVTLTNLPHLSNVLYISSHLITLLPILLFNHLPAYERIYSLTYQPTFLYVHLLTYQYITFTPLLSTPLFYCLPADLPKYFSVPTFKPLLHTYLPTFLYSPVYLPTSQPTGMPISHLFTYSPAYQLPYTPTCLPT